MSTIRFAPQQHVSPPKIDAGKALVPDCPVALRKLPLTKGQIIWPCVMGAAFIGMIGLMAAMFFTNTAFRSSGMGIFALFMPMMMLASFVGIFNRSGFDNKALSPAALEEVRRSYHVALDDTRDEIQADHAREFARYGHLHPPPALLRGLVGSARMWERSSPQQELARCFGHIRVGVGTSKPEKELVGAGAYQVSIDPKKHIPGISGDPTQSTVPGLLLGEPEDYEPVCLDAQRRFILEQSKISGIAKPLPLKEHPLMRLVGDSDTVFGVARAMICQAACFHSPQDLKIMVVTDDPQRWDWLKWLPHNQHDRLVDSGGPARMVWTSSAEVNDAVGQELHKRENFGKGDARPYWLVINDQRRTDSEWDAICRRGIGGVSGVTFVRLEARET